MSPQTDSVGHFYAAINHNDLASISAHFDPHIVRIEPEGFPTAGTYRGLAEVHRHIANGRARWAEGTCNPEAYFENGHKVVVFLHARVRQRESTEWSGGRFADGFAFREGAIIQYLSFAQRLDALRWAGIAEQEPVE